MARNIQTETNPLLYVDIPDQCLHIPEINSEEVKTILSNIPNSSSGYDELPASITKQCTNLYLEPLTLLINMSLSQVISPDQLN